MINEVVLNQKQALLQFQIKAMKLLIILLVFISVLVKIIYGAVFYKIVGKKLIHEATNLVKTVTLKSAEEECLRECLLANECRSFNVFNDEEKLKCDLLNEANGKFIEGKGYSHFSEIAFQKNIETTFIPKTTDRVIAGEDKVISPHQFFRILKDAMCLQYNNMDDTIEWHPINDCQLFYFNFKSQPMAKTDRDKFCLTWRDSDFMRPMFVSHGITIGCQKYIATKFESFYQVKIVEKSGDNICIGNIDNVAVFVACGPEQVVILQMVNDI